MDNCLICNKIFGKETYTNKYGLDCCISHLTQLERLVSDKYPELKDIDKQLKILDKNKEQIINRILKEQDK